MIAPAGAEPPIRVLFCCDPGYYQHLAAAAVSLLDNNRAGQLELHLITPQRDPALEQKLRASLAPFSNFTLWIHGFPLARLASWFTSHHIRSEAYIRLFAASVLPPGIDKILYLDVDLLVLADLSDLWRIELGPAAVAGVPDPFGAPRRAALGLAEGATYVNSGVLLLNLAVWRAAGLERKLAEYIEAEGSRLEHHDQDAVNVVLQDRILVLDYRWNVQAAMLRLPRGAALPDRAAILQAARRPAILHYTTVRKPWRFVMATPAKRLYWRYVERTAWRGARPSDQRWSKVPEHLVNHAFYLIRVNYTWDRVLRATTVGRIIVRSRELLGRAANLLRRPDAATGERTPTVLRH